jgi:hypothetical protein
VATILVCLDDPAPAPAGSCVDSAWIASDGILGSFGLGLSAEEVGTLLSAAIVLWATAYAVRWVIRILR